MERIIVSNGLPERQVRGRVPAEGWILGITILDQRISIERQDSGEVSVRRTVADAYGVVYHFADENDAKHHFRLTAELNGGRIHKDQFEMGLSFTTDSAIFDLFPNTQCTKCGSWGHAREAITEQQCGRCIEDEHDRSGKKRVTRVLRDDSEPPVDSGHLYEDEDDEGIQEGDQIH